MLITTRKPSHAGEILTEEFIVPMGLTQGALADAMGVPRKHVMSYAMIAGASPLPPR